MDQSIIAPQSYKGESDTLAQLYEALSKSQMEMDVASKDSNNPFFKSKYSDLATIVKASRPSLCNHGLSVIQRITTNESGIMFMLTRLAHSSGEWIESKMPITPPKNDIQGIGSYITYLRRYMYSAIVGVISGEDDDGEKAMQEYRKPEPKPLLESQVKLMEVMLKGHPDIKERLINAYKIIKLSDLKDIQFDKCVANIQSAIKAKEEENIKKDNPQ